ncbi:MAG TPA: M20/M25/M40 family metallo-hydrolase, partial [Steroidobacteraceae bacterium]
LAKNRGLILALGGAAVLLAATLLAYRPIVPLGKDASPAVFSAQRALLILQELVGNNVPHPIGSAANARVRDLIVKRLAWLGYSAQLQTGFVCNDGGACGTPTNIIATLGEPSGNDALLIAAHYDSVPSGPGASDDGAGVASVLEIARILKVRPAPPHPIVLLLTDGEEAGLLGARLFVREHPLAKRINAAVNMDARGVSGPSLMFETGTANAWLMHRYAAATLAPITNSLCYVIYKALPNDTDFTEFKAAAYQGFNLAFVGDVGHYHTPLDNWANASASTIQHQGDNALNALLALETSADPKPPAGEALFFDVFARAVVVLPAKAALPAGMAALVLLLAEAALLLRRGLLGGRQALWGAIAALATLLLGGVLSIAVLALLRVFGALPPLNVDAWIAHPLPMHIASVAMAFGVAGAVSAWAARRAGFWGLWLGAASLMVMLAVAAAALLPGASYLLLLTGIAAVLAPLPCVPGWAAVDFAILVPWFVMLAVLLPLLWLVYPALGALAWPLSTSTLALAASLILPLLAFSTSRARHIMIVLAAALTLGGVLLTLALPVYSSRWPQRINVEYWLDSDADHAHWWVYAASSRLPDAMAAVASFDSIPRARFPGSSSMGFFADAPQWKLAAPQLTQTSAAPAASPNATHYELLLQSARGAQVAFVVFPASAKVQDMVVGTSSGPLRAKLRKLPSGDSRLLVSGMPAGGVRFGIDATSQRLAVQVFDQSYGLPEALSGARSLQRARPKNATSAQDGDTTVVQRTVWLDPAAGR